MNFGIAAWLKGFPEIEGLKWKNSTEAWTSSLTCSIHVWRKHYLFSGPVFLKKWHIFIIIIHLKGIKKSFKLTSLVYSCYVGLLCFPGIGMCWQRLWYISHSVTSPEWVFPRTRGDVEANELYMNVYIFL